MIYLICETYRYTKYQRQYKRRTNDILELVRNGEGKEEGMLLQQKEYTNDGNSSEIIYMRNYYYQCCNLQNLSQ